MTSIYLVVTLAVKMNCPSIDPIFNTYDTRVQVHVGPNSRECSCAWDDDTTGVRFTLSKPEAEKALETGARVFEVRSPTYHVRVVSSPAEKIVTQRVEPAWDIYELHRESKTTFKVTEKEVKIK